MTLVALVVAHNLVFLLAYGAAYDEALAHSGHDGYMGDRGRHRPDWRGSACSCWRAGGCIALASSPGRSSQADRPCTRRESVSAGDLSAFGGASAPLRRCCSSSRRMLEHQRVGEGLPGLAVLGSAEYPDAALVIAGVALVVALVGALFLWRRDVLIARIASALSTTHICGRFAPSADRSSFATGAPICLSAAVSESGPRPCRRASGRLDASDRGRWLAGCGLRARLLRTAVLAHRQEASSVSSHKPGPRFSRASLGDFDAWASARPSRP